MELAWWSGESSATEAAGSLTLGMAWWASSNHWRNQPKGGRGNGRRKSLQRGRRPCRAMGGAGKTWLVAPIRQVARGSLLNCSCLLLDRLCCCPRGPCSYGRTRHPAIHG